MLNIYSIKDTKVGFMSPFNCQNDEIAIRSFKKYANDPAPNVVNEFLEDKELWFLGTFDERTGKIEGIEPEFLVKAVDCIIKRSE